MLFIAMTRLFTKQWFELLLVDCIYESTKYLKGLEL